MSRLNQILIVALVAQIGLAVYLNVFAGQTTAAATEPLLADFAADEVVELTIAGSEGETITLAKSGDSWVLPTAADFPADGSKITPVLENLAGIETGRLVTETEGSHAQLEVGNQAFNRRVEVTRQDGSRDIVFLGSSAGAGATHVRVNDQPEVYLTDAISAFEVNPQAASWIDTLYFTTPQTATVALTLENGNGTFEFEKEGELWTLTDLAEGETVDQVAVTTLLNQTHSIRMTEPVGLLSEAGQTFADPLATVTVETGDQTYQLSVGEQDSEDNSYLFSASSSPYYVRVAQFTGDNLINKVRDDFLEVPPEVEGEETTE